jgi:hypothetical protein
VKRDEEQVLGLNIACSFASCARGVIGHTLKEVGYSSHIIRAGRELKDVDCGAID